MMPYVVQQPSNRHPAPVVQVEWECGLTDLPCKFERLNDLGEAIGSLRPSSSSTMAYGVTITLFLSSSSLSTGSLSG